jgi:hypothetical protein
LNSWQQRALIVGGVGLGLSLIGIFLSPRQFFASYLTAFLFWVGFSLGCHGLMLMHNLSGGNWGYAIKRILEAGAKTLPLMAVLFIPIALGLSQIYSWADPNQVAASELLQHKAAYLNAPFFLGRTVLYFVLWIGSSVFMLGWLHRLERDPNDPYLQHRTRLYSGFGLIFYVIGMTFASFDWGMSVEPDWFSTIYGIAFITGQGLTTFAFCVAILAILSPYEAAAEITQPSILNDLGNLLFAFVVLWAYMALSQFLIIWAGNLPEETVWYIHRSRGGWLTVGVLLVVFHFTVPFFVLLSRFVKRRARLLATVAGLILFMRWVDMFWTIAPAFHPSSFYLHWLDLLLPIGMGGIWLAFFIWQFKRNTLVTPLYQPAQLHEVADHG